MLQTFKRLLPEWIFYIALALIVYMPLHVFIAQSASLVTGGLDAWKAAKDVLIVAMVPFLLYLSYHRGLFVSRTFRWLIIIGGIYTLIHMLFVVFDQNDDTYSAILGSVYNTRILGYLLLGYLVGSAKKGQRYLRYLLTATVLIATIVALFGIFQYFLPPDLLTHVGYSLERGVKPLFFIDDRPELPRIMSTLKDPNSLGAYLILPILLSLTALFKSRANRFLFIRSFRREVLAVMVAVQGTALFLTFSRGALIGIFISIVALLFIVTGDSVLAWLRSFWLVPLTALLVFVGGMYVARDTAIVQDYVFHAAVSTDQEDPNEKRITLQKEAIDDIIMEPEGYGPGTAGLVAISNPNSGLLTENYYLQVAYEVGWLGVSLFVTILGIASVGLFKITRRGENKYLAGVLLASLFAYAFYSLLIHLWSNEAVALQWWLLTGGVLGCHLVLKPKSPKS